MRNFELFRLKVAYPTTFCA